MSFFVHLDKSGIITTANGLRIACLGGAYEPNIYGSAEAAPVRVFFLLCVLFDVHNIGLPITIFLPPHDRTATVKHVEQTFDLSAKELFISCFHPSCLNLIATH